MEDKIELVKKIAFFALIFALLSIGIAENLSPTNTTVGLRYVLNTTNLAPTIEPSSPGTGERVADNTTYWANDSPIDVSIWIHANTAGQNSQLKLYINGTEYQNVAGKPISVAEENNKSIFHTIPQYAYYSVVAANYHHYEWRETKILTGNVTTSSGVAGVRWVVNNTNLAPHIPGHPPGTGERVGDNTTYYNNNYPIEIFVYEHKNSVGAEPEIHLYINDTLVEQENRTVVATIPQFSKYSVEVINPIHYIWYEYPILTGNVTTISGTGGSGCTGNCSFDHIRVNGIGKNNTTDPYNLYINLSSGFMSISTINPEFTFMDLNSGSNAIFGYYNVSTGFSSNFYALHDSAEINAGNGTHSSIIVNDTHIDLLPNSLSSANYSFNNTELNMSFRNLTNCLNCEIANNSKLNRTIDNLWQSSVWNWTNNYFPTMYFGGTPVMNRNITTAGTGLGAQAAMNIGLSQSNYPAFKIGDAGGPSIVYSIQGNDGIMKFAGRTNVLWDNSTLNTTEFTVFLKKDSTDTFANSNKVLSCYSNQSCVFYGNVNLTKLQGVGNAYVCINASGVLYRGSPGC